MRQVVNNKNFNALNLLAQHLVLPLLQILVDAKDCQCGVQNCSVYTGLAGLTKLVVTTAFVQVVGTKMKTRMYKGTLSQVCNNLVAKISKKSLKFALQLYTTQTTSLQKGSYKIPITRIDPKLKNLFVGLLYEELFDNEHIWSALGLTTLTREQFHSNFRSENETTNIACPYCDLVTMTSAGTYAVEHFLPKSKFPLLAVDPRNLFTACTGCNGSAGKSSRAVLIVTSPYIEEIGKKVAFDYNFDVRQLNLRPSTTSDVEVDGYLKLLNLPDRYALPQVWTAFQMRKDAVIAALSSGSSQADWRVKFDNAQGGASLTYAVSYWVNFTYDPEAMKYLQ